MTEDVAAADWREKFVYWDPASLGSPDDARDFIGQAGLLPVALGDLVQLSGTNIRAIELLAEEYRSPWERTDPSDAAIIIPCYREEGNIGNLLQEIALQTDGVLDHIRVVVVINGEGTDPAASPSSRAVDAVLPSLPLGVSVETMLLDGRGKLLAHREGLRWLEESETTPQRVIFLDGDAALGEGALASLLEVDEAIPASSVGLALPPNDLYVHSISGHMFQALINSQNSDSASGYLQGGGFGLYADLIPLYKAFCDVLPGLNTVDFNWTAFLQSKNIQMRIDKDRHILLTPAYKSLSQMITQHGRWIRGLLEGEVFGGHAINGLHSSFQIREALDLAKDYFPNYPEVTEKEFMNLFVTVFTGDMPISHYVLLHIASTLFYEGTISVSWYGEKLVFGDNILNPYTSVGWETLR